MVSNPNIIYVGEMAVATGQATPEFQAFFLVHLDPEEERTLMDSLKELGVEAETNRVYCG